MQEVLLAVGVTRAARTVGGGARDAVRAVDGFGGGRPSPGRAAMREALPLPATVLLLLLLSVVTERVPRGCRHRRRVCRASCAGGRLGRRRCRRAGVQAVSACVCADSA